MKIRTLFIFAVLYIFFAGSVSAEQSFDYTVSVKQINVAEECEKVDNSLMNQTTDKPTIFRWVFVVYIRYFIIVDKKCK